MATKKQYTTNKPMYNPAHPGVFLKEMYFKEMKLKIADAAAMLDVDRTTLSRLLNGHISMSVDMALRLGKALNTAPHFWLTMQQRYDLAPIRERKLDLSRVQRFDLAESCAPM